MICVISTCLKIFRRCAPKLVESITGLMVRCVLMQIGLTRTEAAWIWWIRVIMTITKLSLLRLSQEVARKSGLGFGFVSKADSESRQAAISSAVLVSYLQK